MPEGELQHRLDMLEVMAAQISAELRERIRPAFPSRVLQRAQGLGRAVWKLRSDYYDALEREDLAPDNPYCDDGEMDEDPVFAVSLAAADLARLLEVADGSEMTLNEVIGSAAMMYIDWCEGKGLYGGDAGF